MPKRLFQVRLEGFFLTSHALSRVKYFRKTPTRRFIRQKLQTPFSTSRRRIRASRSGNLRPLPAIKRQRTTRTRQIRQKIQTAAEIIISPNAHRIVINSQSFSPFLRALPLDGVAAEPSPGEWLDDNYRPPVDVLFAQCVGLFASLRRQLKLDAPSAHGKIQRVVSQII